MLATTEGIVLHFIKYSESSVIGTIYTSDFGRQSYMINAAHGKKSKNKAGLLQPLFLVDLVAYQKQSRELHRIKEIRSSITYQNIPFDIIKSTQVIFLAEVLSKTLNEQERFPEMYNFIKNSLLYFDLLDKGYSNFHLFFLFRLTEYLGFLPNTNKVSSQGWFDYKRGKIVSAPPSHPFFANNDVSEKLIELAKLKINELPEFELTATMRTSLLTTLLDYYQLHFDGLGEIKSIPVLKEVFR